MTGPRADTINCGVVTPAFHASLPPFCPQLPRGMWTIHKPEIGCQISALSPLRQKLERALRYLAGRMSPVEAVEQDKFGQTRYVRCDQLLTRRGCRNAPRNLCGSWRVKRMSASGSCPDIGSLQAGYGCCPDFATILGSYAAPFSSNQKEDGGQCGEDSSKRKDTPKVSVDREVLHQ